MIVKNMRGGRDFTKNHEIIWLQLFHRIILTNVNEPYRNVFHGLLPVYVLP